MAVNKKRYYWLQLSEDWFSSTKIKRLRKISGGDTFVVIYLKMMLKTLNNNGKFIYEGIEDSVSEEIALAIDENPDNVLVTFNYLLKVGLIKELSEAELLLTEVPERTMSKYDKSIARQQQRLSKTDGNLIEGDKVATLSPECRTYIDIDKDIDIEIDKDIDTTATQQKEVVETILLKNEKEHCIYADQINKWSELYPNVDVVLEIKRMKEWCQVNVNNRKTENDVNRFILNWLANAAKQSKYSNKKSEQKNDVGDYDEILASIENERKW